LPRTPALSNCRRSYSGRNSSFILSLCFLIDSSFVPGQFPSAVSQGLRSTRPRPTKSFTFRVTLKLRPPRTPLGEGCDSPAQLTHRHDADKQRLFCLALMTGRWDGQWRDCG
jgi:hypothetical protein